MNDESSDSNKQNKKSRNIILGIVLLIIFILILILFLYLVRNPAIFGSFAESKNSGGVPDNTTNVIAPKNISYENSYVFASPLKAAIGVEKVRVTVYILDGQGMGIAGKTVTLGNNNSGLTIDPITPTTDDYGRATFDVSSSKAGLYTIEASVGGKSLAQKVTVSFN